MKREDTLGFMIKTLDNLFFRNIVAYEARLGNHEVKIMQNSINGIM